MDTLIEIIIVGMATIFAVALVESVATFFMGDTRIIANIITFPLAVGYHYLLGNNSSELIVVAAASSFASLLLGIIVEKITTQYNEVRRGRR
jgi:ABC-type bacteriocin/lantibiotic exporter with double-glycine peptidase domain